MKQIPDGIRKICVDQNLELRVSGGDAIVFSRVFERSLGFGIVPAGFSYGLSGAVFCYPVTLSDGMLHFSDRLERPEEVLGDDPTRKYQYREDGLVTTEQRLVQLAEEWLVLGLEPEELVNRIRTRWGRTAGG